MTIHLQKLDKIMKVLYNYINIQIKCENIVGAHVSNVTVDFWKKIEEEFNAEFTLRV